MKKSPKSFHELPPIRVRREPPTLVEAVSAAQDLADDIDQQVEIAAGLIGLPPDEVRPAVVEAAARPKPAPVRERFHDHTSERIMSPSGPLRQPRTVVVERRTRPTVIVERRPRLLDPRR